MTEAMATAVALVVGVSFNGVVTGDGVREDASEREDLLGVDTFEDGSGGGVLVCESSLASEIVLVVGVVTVVMVVLLPPFFFLPACFLFNSAICRLLNTGGWG